MGARKVYIWSSSAKSTPQGTFQMICSAIGRLRSNGREKKQVQCLTTDVGQGSQSQGSKRSILTQVKFSENVSEVHLVLETAGQVITCDSAIAEKSGLLERLGLQTTTTQRRGTKFEGLRFAMLDFAAYVAQVTEISGSRDFLGIAVELEYLPVKSTKVAEPILEDFAKILSAEIKEIQAAATGHLVEMAISGSRFGLDDSFGKQHAAVGYVALCRGLARGSA